MSSCAGCSGTATSVGGGGANFPKGGGDAGPPKMQIICHYDLEIEGKHLKGGTTRSESRTVSTPPPKLNGSNIRYNLQEVDHLYTTDGLQFKVFYNDDVFGPEAKLTHLLDGPHDIAVIEFHGKDHFFLARTEPILGGRLGLQIINSKHKTLLVGQGDLVTDNSGKMSLYLSFNIVYPWLTSR